MMRLPGGLRRAGAGAVVAVAMLVPASGAHGQASPSPAPASVDSARLRTALELVNLMQMDKVIQAGNIAMAETQVAANPNLAPFKDVLIKWAETHLTWDRMAPRMAGLYAEALTEQEMRDLMAFYRTPSGQKLIAITPGLTHRSAALGAEMAQQHLPQLEAMMKERMDELTGVGPPDP